MVGSFRSRGAMRTWGWRLAAAVLFLGSLFAVFGGPLLSHVRLSADPLVFNNDGPPHLYPFLRAEGGGPKRPDYMARYFRSAVIPVGFEFLYDGAARLGVV